LVPRLRRFKQATIGYPAHLESMEEWHAQLDIMIRAFELVASDDYFEVLPLDHPDFNAVSEGLRVFSEYYCNLWW